MSCSFWYWRPWVTVLMEEQMVWMSNSVLIYAGGIQEEFCSFFLTTFIRGTAAAFLMSLTTLERHSFSIWISRPRFCIIFLLSEIQSKYFLFTEEITFLSGVCVGVILILVTFLRVFYLDVLKMTVILTRFR